MTKSNRRNVTLALDKELVADARDLDLDLSAVAEAALRLAVQNARRDQWEKGRSEVGAERRAGFGNGGMRLAGWQALQPNSRA